MNYSVKVEVEVVWMELAWMQNMDISGNKVNFFVVESIDETKLDLAKLK